jgi:protein-disulfide isomerase
VQRLSPQSFWAYSARLFAHQTEFFDVAVVNETRNATYRRLAELAAEEPGIAVDAVYDLLKISDVPDENGDMNVGNAVTQDLKTVIKMARLVGVHVSPTVIFDGVVENAISSSWTKEQWNEFLEKRVV